MVETAQHDVRTYTVMVEGKELTIQTGKLAMQAGGAVTVQVGETMLFCTATMSRSVREGLDFFPLSVDYEEKLYAAGSIPGGWGRREGRPSDNAILISRVIDRTLRPLFPDGMRNEVQIILTSLAHDQENHVDMLGIIAASTAIMISDIPWDGPVAGARVGLIDDELVVNPTISMMEKSLLDLRVSGTGDSINMVECGAKEVDEETMLKALKLAHQAIQPVIELQKQIQAEIGKEKAEIEYDLLDENIYAAVRERVLAEIQQITQMTDRDARNEAVDALKETVRAEYEAQNAALLENDPDAAIVNLKDVKESISNVYKKEVRRRITDDGVRPDGRDTVTIRALSAEVGLIPRVHGSGLFQRGLTQVLTIATLGTPRDSQILDGLVEEERKRYMHHYNFPPFSTGETWFLRGPKRREIGHGTLAENALLPMIPEEADFPYTVRLVSEVMSSNGSTSMASVCGSTLALMDAGVPIKAPVAGIAMGLIKEGDNVAVLTDIQGLEDHLGDMDFKVAGTDQGITALQMDIKIAGLPDEVMERALAQARDARLEILSVMREAIAEPRPDLRDSAPRMITLKIDPEKIGAVIGPGGKIVRGIQDAHKVTIEIAEDGTVFIAGEDGPSVYMAQDKVRGLTEDVEPGRIYTGKITRTEGYGVFVELLPGKEGLVHVSQLADYRITSVEAEFNVGDEIMVMVTDVDRDGRVRLSRQAVLEGWSLDEAKNNDPGIGSGGGGRGGRDRGGNRGGGGNNRSGGGNNRGGGGNNRSGGGNNRSGGGNRRD